jgi:hypothetical protein
VWWILQQALVGWQDQLINNGQSGIQLAITSTSEQYHIRTIATVGAILLVLYADRHPLYKGASFGALVGLTLITMSWFVTSLPFVFSMLGTNIQGSLWFQLHTQFGGVVLGNAVMSIIHITSIFALWCYVAFKNLREYSLVKTSIIEKVIHGLTWLGLIGYIVWTAAAINVATNINYLTITLDLLNEWSYNDTHAFVVFALTTSAVASMGADQGWRVATFFMNIGLFFELFPGAVYDARTTALGGVPTLCQNWNNNTLCQAQSTISAGMIVVSAAAFLISVASVPLVLLGTSSYDGDVTAKTSTNDPIDVPHNSVDPHGYTAGDRPIGEDTYQPSITEQEGEQPHPHDSNV